MSPSVRNSSRYLRTSSSLAVRGEPVLVSSMICCVKALLLASAVQIEDDHLAIGKESHRRPRSTITTGDIDRSAVSLCEAVRYRIVSTHQ